MHLIGCLPLALLALASLVTSSQVPFEPPRSSSNTLVSCLSNDSDYSTLLHLLQRAKLIPTLNKLNGSTFFAPTNDAIERHVASNSLWRRALNEDNLLLADNLQERLRQELFYHLLNYSLEALPSDSDPRVEFTLHYPRKLGDPPTHEPPPSPPWMPVPGGTLGGEPQRLRLSARDGNVWVGVDAFGNGGAKVIKDPIDAGNGILLGIGDVLTVPADLATEIFRHKSVSYFDKINTTEVTELLNGTSEITLFLPVNEAWQNLHPLERLYLESEWAADDLNRIIRMHAVHEEAVQWSEAFYPAKNLSTIHGTNLEIVVGPEKTTVSSADLVQPDIYAANGVMHLVSSFIIPPGALQLTPEKYLLALNCTSFVSLIHSVDLTQLINDTNAEYTILAPKDDVLSIFGQGELPEPGSEELKKLLKYHFVPGRWTPKKLKNGMLLETALDEPGLDGGKQVLDVEVDGTGKGKSDQSLVMSFGGATVIGDYIEINNTLIYFVSRPVTPPSNALQTALPILNLSSFLAAIFSTSLAEVLKTTPRTTFLIPHNSAFKRLGLLVSEHLLSASSQSDLERVILHHVIDGVEYAGYIQNGSQRTFPTLEQTDIQVERRGNGTLLVNPSGGWAGMRSEVYLRNMLTETGVIHEVSDILLPRSVSLTIGKLAKAAKGTTMASVVVKAGMDWILNGTSPPEGSPWADKGVSGVGWTLLCPTDDAFKKMNLTELFQDVEGLQAIVSQHLVQSVLSSPPESHVFDELINNRPLSLDSSAAYSTLLSSASLYGDVVFRPAENSPSGYVIGIKGARGTDGQTDWARVMSWGRTTTGGGIGGVIQIDRLLMPYQPPWWIEYGAPAVVGVFGIILIGMFFSVVRALWRRDTTEATYEPVGGFGRDDDS